MKKRSAEILRRLIDAPSHRLRLGSLMDDYRISEKTLKADIASTAAFAQDPRGASMVMVTDEHVSLVSGSDVEGLEDLLDSMDLYDYRLGFEERRYFIACTLLMLEVDEWCPMQQLADAMYVTRNTVISDMKAVDEYLTGYGIALVSKSKLGVRAQGTPDRVRDLLIDMCVTILSERLARHDYFSHLIGAVLGATFELDEVVDAVRAFLKARNIFLSIEVERQIDACLAIALGCRISLGTSDDTFDQPLDMIGELVEFVAAKLDLGHLDSTRNMQIERMILGRNLLPQIKKFDDFDLYCAITHFLLLVGRGLDIDIQNDDLLVEALLSHLKSVASWSSDAFEVNVAGPSGVMVGMVQTAALPHFHVLEDYLRRPLDDSMRASVVIHICAALYRSESGMRSCNVLVSCPSSVATSRYLEAQVKSYFKLNVCDVTATQDIEDGSASLKDIDFIISTVPIDVASTPVVVVSPVLSVDDINKIQACAFRCSRSENDESGEGASIITRLRDVYAQGNRRKTAYLNRALARVLENVERIERETTSVSPLLRMLERKHICVESGALSWRDAIRLASERLMNEGFFTSAYVDAAIEHVEEYGSYIIVNQGIALAHAGSGDGALKDGLGLLVCSDGAIFDGGERVYLMFFFSQVSDGDYLDLFREIIRLGNDVQGMERIRKATDSETVHQLLVEMLTDYSENGD